MNYKHLLLAIVPVVVLAQDQRTYDIQSTNNNITELSASAAAPLSVAICQRGFSGQIVEGGFTITNADAFCDLIKLSEVMLNASNVHQSMGNTEYAALYMDYHHKALEDANALIVNTKYTSYISRIADSLLVPIMLIVGAILLL